MTGRRLLAVWIGWSALLLLAAAGARWWTGGRAWDGRAILIAESFEPITAAEVLRTVVLLYAPVILLTAAWIGRRLALKRSDSPTAG